MTIPILLMQPEVVTDTSACGGRMTNNQVVQTAGGAGNFPSLSPAELASGVEKIRKLFFKLADSANPTVPNAKAFMKNVNPIAGVRSVMVHGTQRDTVATMGTRKYEAGVLNTAVNASDTVLIVDFKVGSAADAVVQAGDALVIIDGTTEQLDYVVDSVSWSGNQATITLTTGVLTALNSGVIVSSAIVDTTNTNPSFSNVVKSFVGSTYDETTYPVLVENLSCIEQTVTLTFTSATAFTVISDKLGALASGNVSSDYAPMNADFALPYFTLQAAGWGGTHTAGESLQFQVHPAAVPIYVIQKFAAGTATGINVTYPSIRVAG